MNKRGFMIIDGNQLIRYNEHSDGVKVRTLNKLLSAKKIGTNEEIELKERGCLVEYLNNRDYLTK